MLAKIAHAVTIGWLGLDAFVPYLPPLILGNDENAAYLVGGAEAPTKPEPRQPYSASHFEDYSHEFTWQTGPSCRAD
jgi:hypothetical protein